MALCSYAVAWFHETDEYIGVVDPDLSAIGPRDRLILTIYWQVDTSADVALLKWLAQAWCHAIGIEYVSNLDPDPE
ncbi:MAG: hypothetical protein HYY50_02110 [Candidatus Kerfeldbacteria bacterium]|nr:hypothetical protein [Candidatus Kerfeldbacteria bacterium]